MLPHSEGGGLVEGVDVPPDGLVLEVVSHGGGRPEGEVRQNSPVQLLEPGLRELSSGLVDIPVQIGL